MANFTIEEETSNLAHLKRLKEKAKSTLPNDTILDLPDPAYREALGDVRRRTNRTVRAEPPPPPTTQASSAPRYQRSSGRRRLNNGFDGDDGSDSDGSDPRRGHGESNAPVTRRQLKKQLPLDPVEPAKASSSSSMSLTPEEEERIRLRRTLQNNPGAWQSALQTFKKNDFRAFQRKTALTRHRFNVPKNIERNPDVTVIRLQDKLMLEFLNESLGRDSDAEDLTEGGEVDEDPDRERSLLSDVIERIELDLIIRFKGLAGSPEIGEEGLNEDLEPITIILLAILRQWHILRYILESFPKTRTPFDECVFSYTTIMFDHIEASLLGSSRENGYLSPSYIDYIYSQLPRREIASVLRDRRQAKCYQVRGEKIRSAFHSIRKNIVQAFCEDTTHQGGIVLVRPKDSHLALVRHVSPQDLDRLGWVRDDEEWGGEYWRYSFDERFGAVFRIAMDGTVKELAGHLHGD
ncbi:hypothetical protein F4805DRAFT_202094 [Annulohypoxylon moriforme]|nr:hypothetical protein F4805DRAFT_202094 [Annulohypoxylon moriforme]